MRTSAGRVDALRGSYHVRWADPCQPRLQPPDVKVQILGGRSAEGLDEFVVAGVKQVHVLDVIAARRDARAGLGADQDVFDAAVA